MQNEPSAEQITLYTADDVAQTEPTEESFQRVTLQLQQIQRWKRQSLTVQVLEDRYACVQQYRNGKFEKYWLHLLFLNANPVREWVVDWRWGIAALICALLAALIHFADKIFHFGAAFPYTLSAIVLLATATLLLTLTMLYRMKHALRITTLYGRAPVIEFTANKPSKAEFEAFLQSFCQRIQASQSKSYFDKSSHLAAELGEHRRLYEKGLIEETVYKRAKKNILASH
jgi:hypothetical protein